MLKRFVRIVSICLLLVFLSSQLCFAQAAVGVSVYLDGTNIAQGFIENGRTLVPIRVLSEGMGYAVSWDGEAQMVTVEKENVKNKLIIGSMQATTIEDGIEKEVLLDTAPCIMDSRTYVPLRYIAESLGSNVFWQGKDDGGGNAIVCTPIEILLEGVSFSTKTLTKTGTLEQFGAPYDTIAGADGVERLIYMRPETKTMLVFGFCEDKLFEFFTNDTDVKIAGVNVLQKNSAVEPAQTTNVFYDSLQDNLPVGLYINMAGKYYSPYQSMTNKDAVMQQEGKLAFYLTNALRRKAGVQDLVFSEALADVDKAHVASMAENGFFAHEGLDGSSIKERISTAPTFAKYKRAGEILAKMPNAYYACYGWLNSKSHRENMLSDAYVYTGICVDGNLNENLYYAQVLVKL